MLARSPSECPGREDFLCVTIIPTVSTIVFLGSKDLMKAFAFLGPVNILLLFKRENLS